MGGRFKITLVLFALVAALVAGCGGDDETTTSSGPGTTNGSASDSGSAGSPADGSSSDGDSGSAADDGSSGSESGSDDGSANGGAQLSTDEFIAKGNQICLDTRDEIGEEIKALVQSKEDTSGGAGVETAEEIAEDIVLPHFQTQNEELRELAVPAGDEAQVEAFLARFESEVADAEADPKVLLGSTVSPFLETRKLAIKYGLTKCGRL